MTDIYISADIESDGPIPGKYSMLAFGLVYAGRFDGQRFERADLDAAPSFYRELRPIAEASLPDAVAASGLDRDRLLREGAAPEAAMTEAAAWVRALAAAQKGNAVLVAFPLGFDFAWLTWYFEMFAPGGSPFGHARGMDIKTAYAVKAGIRFSAAGRDGMPEHLRSKRPHTHNALDDAREQADVFANVMEWKP